MEEPKTSEVTIVGDGSQQGFEISDNGVLRAYRYGAHLVIQGSTWRINPKVTRATYAEAYEKNPVIAERDFGAIPSRAVEDAIHDKTAIERFSKVRPNPFSSTGALADWFVADPRYEYFLHIDMSKARDNTGLSMSHWIPEDGICFVDFIHTWVRMENWELAFSRVEQFVMELHKRGFKLKVSFDSWQSYMMLERLTANQVKVELFSVDRGTFAYDTLIGNIFSERVNYPVNALFIQEMNALRLYDGEYYDHPANGCFTGDTRIPLLDGTSPTMRELDGKDIWVYSYSLDHGIVPGRGRCFQSKQVTKLLEVSLDNKSVHLCTPDHLWMMRDGSYKKAEDLKSGDRLMLIHFSMDVHGYERVSDRDGTRTYTHYMALGGKPAEGYVGHHVNGVKTNNSPDNLVVLDRASHVSIHAREAHLDPVFHSKTTKALQAFNESPEGRKLHSEISSRLHAGRTKADYSSFYRKRKNFRADLTIEKVAEHKALPNAEQVSNSLGCSRNTVIRLLNEAGYPSWKDFQESFGGLNHKVVSVKAVALENPVPVYDISVETWNNFALAGGVFVHNSKDTSDAVAGAVARCFKSLQGMTFTQAEIEDATHNEAVLDVTYLDNAGFHTPQYNGVYRDVKGIRFGVRIDSVDDQLLVCLGHQDKKTSQTVIDGFYIWDAYSTYDATCEGPVLFLQGLIRDLDVFAFSLNESVPLELISFIQSSGKRFVSALAARKNGQGQLIRSTSVNRKSIQIFTQQIKKGAVLIPKVENLIRDLSYMTEDNILDRRFVRCAAGFVEFFLKQFTVGAESRPMVNPKIATSSPGRARNLPGIPMGSIAGGGQELDHLRVRNNLPSPTSASVSAPSSRKNFPTPAVGSMGRGGHK